MSNNRDEITSKPDIKLDFKDLGDQCVGIKQTKGGTLPSDSEIAELVEHMGSHLALDVTVVLGIDLDHVNGTDWDGHDFLFVYEDNRSIKLPSRHGTVKELSPDPAVLDQRVFEFKGAVVVRKGGKGIKDQRAIRCPGQRVVLTFNP